MAIAKRSSVEDHPNRTGKSGARGLPGNANLVPVDLAAVQLDMVNLQVWMRQERETQMVSANALGKAVGVAGSTITCFELDQNNLNVEQLLRITRGLGYKLQVVPLVERKGR